MGLKVLLGGARSGKSLLAVELAAAAGAPVAYIATGEARDVEMTERIAAHRAERPGSWTTVEEPYALEQALTALGPTDTVIVDCLTLWVANVLARGDGPPSMLEAATTAARAAGSREGLTIAVTNEVGLGIVPATPLGRAYRDLLGSVNRVWVDESEEAVLVIAGRGLSLHQLGTP